MILRLLVFLHRWIGIALCVLFLLWFPSGIGMMYWSYPSVSAGDRLDHSPALDASKIVLSPLDAAQRLGLKPGVEQVRLNTFDGRPVYRFGGGGRRGGGERIIYADTGDEQTEVTRAMRDRMASAWSGRSAATAQVESMDDVDQWTVQAQLRNLRPLYKYSWSDGQQLYMAGNTGEVVQYTTTASRIQAHLSAIPHWIYYTPLRKRQPLWLNFMIWTSGVGAIAALAGIVIAVWVYSPKRRYRLKGRPASLPYRGQKRWHAIFGLLFGIATVTWSFSGMLSLDPFPSLQRQPPQNRQGAQGGTRGIPTVPGALRGRVALSDFSSMHPRDLVSKFSGTKELEFSSFDGLPVFAANLGRGKVQMVSLDGAAIPEFDHQRIAAIVRDTASDPGRVEFRTLNEYDLYYLDRDGKRPLPVILALMNDAEKTRYYVDPKTARVTGTYSNRNWVGRWLYNGLHSLNFPWLYKYRPLWDIVVITFMLGGTALSATSLVLAWRVLGRKLKRVATKQKEDMAAAAPVA